MGILGLVLAIPTAGTSLVLTYGGVALGVAGTVTSVTASTINDGWEKSERDAFRSEMKKILRLQGFINTFLEKMNSAAEFLKTDKGKEAILDHLKLSTAWDDKLKVAVNVGEGVWDLYKIQGTAVKTYKDAKTYMTAMKMFKDFGLGDWYAVNGVKQGIAAFASAPEIALPGFLGGKVLVSAAGVAAKVISGGFALIGAIMGIREMVISISKINNGSEMAAEFRKAADEVQTRVNNIIQLDEELKEI